MMGFPQWLPMSPFLPQLRTTAPAINDGERLRHWTCQCQCQRQVWTPTTSSSAHQPRIPSGETRLHVRSALGRPCTASKSIKPPSPPTARWTAPGLLTHHHTTIPYGPQNRVGHWHRREELAVRGAEPLAFAFLAVIPTRNLSTSGSLDLAATGSARPTRIRVVWALSYYAEYADHFFVAAIPYPPHP